MLYSFFIVMMFYKVLLKWLNFKCLRKFDFTLLWKLKGIALKYFLQVQNTILHNQQCSIDVKRQTYKNQRYWILMYIPHAFGTEDIFKAALDFFTFRQYLWSIFKIFKIILHSWHAKWHWTPLLTSSTEF